MKTIISIAISSALFFSVLIGNQQLNNLALFFSWFLVVCYLINIFSALISDNRVKLYFAESNFLTRFSAYPAPILMVSYGWVVGNFLLAALIAYHVVFFARRSIIIDKERLLDDAN